MKLNLIFILTLFFINISCSKLKIQGVKPKRNDFRVLWAKNFDGQYETGNMPISLNSPLIHEGIVYAGSEDGNMNAFQASDGRLLWSQKEKGSYHAAPMIHKDLVIFGTNQGRVVARKSLSGDVVYKVDLDASVESTGVVYKGRLFFHTRNHKIFCLDVMTGKILWSYKRSVPFLTTLQRVSKPLIHDGKAYVGFADGHVLSFSIEDGVVLWERKISEGNKFIDVDLSPIVFKNKLIVASMDGGLMTLNPKTGQLLRKFKYQVLRTPLVHNGHLFLGTTTGSVIELDSYFAEVKNKKLLSRAISSMKIWKNNLVVTTLGDKVYFVETKGFTILSHYSLGSYYSAVFGEVKVKDGLLALLSSRNRLYIFK